MARPGRGSRRRDDELLLLLFALRRRRLARSSGRVPLWPFALAAVVLVVAALAGGAVAAGRAVQSALSDCSLAGKEAKALPITSVVYARNGYYLGAIPAPIHPQPGAHHAKSPRVQKGTLAAAGPPLLADGRPPH